MTVITFVSVKGSPGVTTLACLVGATWPDRRRVAVVEADPFGGDLAARFRLSAARGWTSYATAVRRSEGPVPLEPHLQALPGGLDVVIGARGARQGGSERAVEALLESCSSSQPTPWDLVVDGGRLLPDDGANSTTVWLDRSESVVVVVRRDAPSVLKVRDRSQALVDRYGDRVRLVVVGSGRHPNSAIEDFTGIPVIGEVPLDLPAAQVASGEGGAGRHLSRSLLVVSARRLSVALAGPDHDGVDGDSADGDGGIAEGGSDRDDRNNRGGRDDRDDRDDRDTLDKERNGEERGDSGSRRVPSMPAIPVSRAVRHLRRLRRGAPQDAPQGSAESSGPDRPDRSDHPVGADHDADQHEASRHEAAR